MEISLRIQPVDPVLNEKSLYQETLLQNVNIFLAPEILYRETLFQTGDILSAMVALKVNSVEVSLVMLQAALGGEVLTADAAGLLDAVDPHHVTSQARIVAKSFTAN